MRRSAIPLGDLGTLLRPARRTLAFRLGLAAALLGALAAAYFGAHHTGKHASILPGGKSPIVAIDMSWSVSYDNYDQIEKDPAGPRRVWPADRARALLGHRLRSAAAGHAR